MKILIATPVVFEYVPDEVIDAIKNLSAGSLDITYEILNGHNRAEARNAIVRRSSITCGSSTGCLIKGRVCNAKNSTPMIEKEVNIMTTNELKRWIDERLKSAQNEVNLAYEEWDKTPYGEMTMEGFNKILQFKAIRDEILIIKTKIDELEES